MAEQKIRLFSDKKTILLIGIVFIFLFFGLKVFAAECSYSPQVNTVNCQVSLTCADNPPGTAGESNSGCSNETYYCYSRETSCQPGTFYSGPFSIATNGTFYVWAYSKDNAGNAESPKLVKTVIMQLGDCFIGGQSYNAGDCNGKCQICNPAYPNQWSNISSGSVCFAGTGQIAVSSTTDKYCNYGEDCDSGDCSAKKWWTSCNGSGSCRSAGSSPPSGSLTENIYAQEGRSLTSNCGTAGSVLCDSTWRASLGLGDNNYGKGGNYNCQGMCDGAGSCEYAVNCQDICTRGDPTVSLIPSSQTGSPGQALSYTVRVGNNDSVQCGESTFDLTNSCPTGWGCSLNSGSTSVNPGSTATLSISITSLGSALEGNYSFSVTARNSADSSYLGTGSANYIVAVNPFDFTISFDPTSGSVLQGESVATNVTVETIAGLPETIYLSASGLPPNANQSFSPNNNCLPDGSCFRGMLISTSAATPVGNYQITVCGSNSEGSITRCSSFYGLNVSQAEEGVSPPRVTTGEATSVNETSATLNATLNSLGGASSCLVWFEWGTDPSNYENITVPVEMTSPGSFSVDITGLDSQTTYYFEAKAKNGGNLLVVDIANYPLSGTYYKDKSGNFVPLASDTAFPIGDEVTLRQNFENNSGEPLPDWSMSAVVTYPDSTTQNLTEVSRYEGSSYVIFSPFAVSQEGLYTPRFTLNVLGQTAEKTSPAFGGANPAVVVFTSVGVSNIAVQADSGWWGTNYYAVMWHTIVWNAAHRVPTVEGSGSASISVSWQLSKGAATMSGGYTTTPQTREPSGAMLYYFQPGIGSVGQPYAGSSISFGSAPPATGPWNYIINVKAIDSGTVVGENTFQGTVNVN